MAWINNTKKKKPDIDERYKENQYSVSVLIHIKLGLTFIGYWDYEKECWFSDMIRIEDNDVLFWCKIPKLPNNGTIFDKKNVFTGTTD